MEFKPYPYQQRAVDFVRSHRRCALFLDMGLGKSVISLTAVQELIDDIDIDRVLVVAPKKVAEATWSAEAGKWDHLAGLRVSKVMGTPKQRQRALATDADVYVIGRDSFVWLVNYYKARLPFDMIIIDELTSFKTPKSKRFKAMKLVTASAGRVVGLTGTPTPNGYLDLWAQIYCIDKGERLGKYVTHYREKYFDTFRVHGIPIRTTLRAGAEEQIREKLKDICLTMQARDYLTLPGLMVHDVPVALPASVLKAYREFERDKVLEFAGSGKQIAANSAAALMNKLSQYANGAVYDSEHTYTEVHGEKLDALEELVEGLNGEPVLVYYQYRHDAERIARRLQDYRVREYEDAATLEAWNTGEIDVLLAHPASVAYGLNMQQGGHYIVWYGCGWDLELYQQANARLYRQGQKYPVTVYRLIAQETVDLRAARALNDKDNRQKTLLDAMQQLVKIYETSTVAKY